LGPRTRMVGLGARRERASFMRGACLWLKGRVRRRAISLKTTALRWKRHSVGCNGGGDDPPCRHTAAARGAPPKTAPCPRKSRASLDLLHTADTRPERLQQVKHEVNLSTNVLATAVPPGQRVKSVVTSLTRTQLTPTNRVASDTQAPLAPQCCRYLCECPCAAVECL
jgi:hypothetical protein